MQREHIYDVPWMETSDDKRTKKKEKKEKKNKQINKSTLTVMLSSRLTLDYKLHEQLCPVWCASQSWA
jgi:hypothetical protein